jgi:hypothetical protein
MEGGLDWRKAIEELFGGDQSRSSNEGAKTNPDRVFLSLYLEDRWHGLEGQQCELARQQCEPARQQRECRYLTEYESEINMSSYANDKTGLVVTLKRSKALVSSFSHFLISSASLCFLRARSKADLFARSSENAAMLFKVLRRTSHPSSVCEKDPLTRKSCRCLA